MQAFNWVDSANVLHVFTYTPFVTKLLYHLSTLGLDPRSCAGYSFRWGGASFAYQLGVPIELIKALGSWLSDTILIYLTMPLTVHLHSTNCYVKQSYYTLRHILCPNSHSLFSSHTFTGFGPE